MNNLLLEDLNKEINIKKSSIINGININKDIDLKINVFKNVDLSINIFTNDNNKDIKLDIILNDNSKLNLNISFISNKKYNLIVNTTLKGDNIESNVNIRGINRPQSNTNINMDGIILKGTKDNYLNEYAKVINKSNVSSVKIVPNLIVDSMDSYASHGAAIFDVSKTNIKYLMSKGLNREDAINLLEKSFILEIMDDDIKSIIKDELNGGI